MNTLGHYSKKLSNKMAGRTTVNYSGSIRQTQPLRKIKKRRNRLFKEYKAIKQNRCILCHIGVCQLVWSTIQKK